MPVLNLYQKAIFILLLMVAGKVTAKDYILKSPDQKIGTVVHVGDRVRYELSYEGNVYLRPSAIGITLSDGRVLGVQPKVIRTRTSSTDRWITPVYSINSSLPEHFNELVLEFSGNFSIVFRAYNEGFAYRLVTNFKEDIVIKSEQCEFNFNGNYQSYFHPALSEADYRLQNVSDVLNPNYSSLPLLLKATDGLNVLLHESDVHDYPCLSVSSVGIGQNALHGNHAAYPKSVYPNPSGLSLLVKETEDYIAKTQGTRSFPWRLISFEKQDAGILNNQLVYLLAPETKLKDVSWIRPGKVAWDWWNALNLSGVDFKTGFNTETYKYFIDFAAKNGIQYINLDEGWSDLYDLLKTTDKLDMAELMAYAKKKNVGVILWCVWHALDRQMPAAMDQFEKWGIAGLKVDFMERDDQVVVNFQERLLKEAAKHKMLVNYHGAYHPNGMERAYPNQINTEAVKGLEWNKFDPAGSSPQTDVLIPFIRMFAGAMDYTPGAMSNYNKTEWKQVFDRPESQGTRCHQLAMYTIYYGPLQMLSDAPTAYEKEPVFLKYLAEIPVVWDQTVPLDSKVGEYVTIARRKDKDWFLASMTNWTARSLKIKLDFLEAGKAYRAEIFRDGVNAERIGNDYARILQQVKQGDQLSIDMASGGGYSVRFSLAKQ